jgi:hypothetical protein
MSATRFAFYYGLIVGFCAGLFAATIVVATKGRAGESTRTTIMEPSHVLHQLP